MQEDRLWIADPKAINHILQKSGYLYTRPSSFRERAELVGGRGIMSIEGELPITATKPFLQSVSSGGRRRAQASQEGDGPSVWPRRGSRSVPVFHGFRYQSTRTSPAFDLERLIPACVLDGRQVEQHHRERQIQTFGGYRCEHVVREGYSRCVCPRLGVRSARTKRRKSLSKLKDRRWGFRVRLWRVGRFG